MKVNLRQEESVSILEVSGPLDHHNFQVLKAGITKLLRSGKNRIVLSLIDATALESDTLREIAIIDVYARELAGKIVLASGSEELKESVKLFAKPPVIPILSSVELAIDYFKKAEPLAEEEEDVGALKAKLEAKAKEVEALEARLKLQDPKEMNELRSANAELKAKISLLEGQVDQMVKEKRQPVDAEGFLEKVATMEDMIKRLSAPGKT